VLGPNALEVNGELGLDRDGQQRRAVLVAFAAPDADLVAAEVAAGEACRSGSARTALRAER
jgi:hypothetical protein